MLVQHIDTAVTYRNEAAVGEALSEFLRSKQAQRSDLFVTTKLWSNQHGIDQVEPAVRESLSKLHLEYLDLLLIHWPVSDKPAPQLIPSAQACTPFLCAQSQLCHNYSKVATTMQKDALLVSLFPCLPIL